MALKADGLVPWVLQRISGALLVAVLGIHFWLLHYRDPGEMIIFEDVMLRLRTPGFLFLDYGLLGLTLFHALNGVRNVVLDYSVPVSSRKALTVMLWIAGVIFFGLGVWALVSFSGGGVR